MEAVNLTILPKLALGIVINKGGNLFHGNLVHVSCLHRIDGDLEVLLDTHNNEVPKKGGRKEENQT